MNDTLEQEQFYTKSGKQHSLHIPFGISDVITRIQRTKIWLQNSKSKIYNYTYQVKEKQR